MCRKKVAGFVVACPSSTENGSPLETLLQGKERRLYCSAILAFILFSQKATYINYVNYFKECFLIIIERPVGMQAIYSYVPINCNFDLCTLTFDLDCVRLASKSGNQEIARCFGEWRTADIQSCHRQFNYTVS